MPKDTWEAGQGRDPYGRPIWNVRNVEKDQVVVRNICEELAQQIVREHNAHAELVEVAKEYRENRREACSPGSLGGNYHRHLPALQEKIARIDAVLARAEGRTE